MLQPLDVMLAIKLAVNKKSFTQAELALELDVSASQVNRALKRCENSGLIEKEKRQVIRPALIEFLVHGIKYAFPGEVGPVKRGMPTAHSALPIATKMGPTNVNYVWPVPTGELRGESVKPLYKTAPFAANLDSRLYETLALIDAIRIGRASEKNLAKKAIQTIIGKKYG